MGVEKHHVAHDGNAGQEGAEGLPRKYKSLALDDSEDNRNRIWLKAFLVFYKYHLKIAVPKRTKGQEKISAMRSV